MDFELREVIEGETVDELMTNLCNAVARYYAWDLENQRFCPERPTGIQICFRSGYDQEEFLLPKFKVRSLNEILAMITALTDWLGRLQGTMNEYS